MTRFCGIELGHPVINASGCFDAIASGKVDLVINTPTGSGARSDGWEIRRAAVARGIPCITTLSGGQAAIRAIRAAREGEPAVVSLQEIHRR